MSANADWDLFQSLHAVIKAGSLSRAAKLRGLTQPTLGRHIEALEGQLGGPLFLRSPRGLEPTDLATELAGHLEDMAAAAGAAVRDASGSANAVRGAVRLTASEIMGVEVLPPILTSFRESHPEVEIELVLSNRNEDLTRRDADIAVRMIRPTQNTLVARKVGVTALGFYATPEYVAKHGAPADMGELARHPLVGFDKAWPNLRALADLDLPVSREAFSYRCDSDLAQLAAVRAGFGIGACQHILAGRYGLVAILPDAFGFNLDIWVAMHERLKANKRMRLMFDHMADGLAAFLKGG
jgi:DNA-binding transcriptional LysR family regulator